MRAEPSAHGRPLLPTDQRGGLSVDASDVERIVVRSGPERRSGGRLRVLWLIKSLYRGGAERLLEVMARHMDRQRIHVEVAYLLRSADAIVPELAGHRIPVHCLGVAHDADLSWVPRLRALVRSRKYDLVHSHSPLTGAVARLVLPRWTPHLYTEHNVWAVYRGVTRRLNALTYGRNERVFAVSREVARSITASRMARHGRMPPVEVLYHGIDEHAVRSGPKARRHARGLLGLGENDVVLGCVANFRPEKQHHALLTCFATLASRHPHIRLVLVGGGPLGPELQARVEREGLQDRVLFTGTRSDVQTLLPGFDVFALSSTAEGLPIALLEAMASGLPVVATAVGGVPEVLVDGQGGLLVRPNDSGGLLAALERLLLDETLRMETGSTAAWVASRFSAARAAGRLQQVYESVAVSRDR